MVNNRLTSRLSTKIFLGKTKTHKKDALPRGMRPYRWTKGQSGNPSGRPPGIKSLTKLYRQQLDEPAHLVPAIADRAKLLGLNPSRTTIGAVLSLSQIHEAILGKANAAKDIADRVDAAANKTLNRIQIVSLAEAIADIINQEVRDPQVRAVIAERIAGLVGTVEYSDDGP
jgi:hypothetical protein